MDNSVNARIYRAYMSGRTCYEIQSASGLPLDYVCRVIGEFTGYDRVNIPNLIGGYSREIYMPLFWDVLMARRPSFRTIQDVPHTLKYVHNARVSKTFSGSVARKTLITAMRFLNASTCEYVLCVGRLRKFNLHLFTKIYPGKKFLLVSDERFDVLVDGRSHRDTPHEDIIQLLSARPTLANCEDVPDDQVREYIEDSPRRIFIFETYDLERIARMLQGLELDLLYTNQTEHVVCLSDMAVTIDMFHAYSLMRALRPRSTMLRVRMLRGTHEATSLQSKKLQHAIDAARPEIDFLRNYQNGVVEMFRGELYLQPWSNPSSTELCLVIPRENLDQPPIVYDAEDIDNRLCYYNNVVRSWACCGNPHADPQIGLCHCCECFLEADILAETTSMTIPELIGLIDGELGRTLYKTHDVHIWGPIVDVPKHANAVYASHMYRVNLRHASKGKA